MKKIAVIVGHDRNESGAYSTLLSKSEYLFNSEVASLLESHADIYFRPLEGGYCKKMDLLANQINQCDYDYVFELHFNSFNGKAEGCEAVVYTGNQESIKAGKLFLSMVSERFGTKIRSVLERSKPNERGGCFLSKMKANALILEPFFGDNEESLRFERYSNYANMLKSYFEKL